MSEHSVAAGAPAPGRLRMLVDLAHAADGFVGIAQDIRLNFDMLASLPEVEVAGLLFAAGRHDLPRIDGEDRENVAVQAGVLHWMTRNWDTSRLHHRRGRIGEVRSSLRTSHEMVPFLANRNAIWRTLFEKTLTPDRRAAILASDFYATDLSVIRIVDRVLRLRMLPPHRLATPGFDFALFSMPRPVRLSPGTRQLVRFHDAVPVTEIDTQDNWINAVSYQALVRRCSADAVFVCNSPQSLEDLDRLDPRRSALARVVPCALAPRAVHAAGIAFDAVAAVRRTFRTLEMPPKEKPPIPEGLRYVLNIGTLEPRKNQVGLIRAWERVIARSDPDLALVIVGNTGWNEGPIVNAMRPHVAAGRIIHLERVPIDELHAVAAAAECFAFPSFAEGFGYPPLEAMQAGAACVISDIPVFRWIFGEAAAYVDPYDAESIAQGIERVVTHPRRQELRRELAARAPAVLERFSTASISAQWRAMLDGLRGRGAGGRGAAVPEARVPADPEPALRALDVA